MSALKRLTKPNNILISRRLSHWLEKNRYLEENAGVREISYKRFAFDGKTNLSLLGFLIIPGMILYASIKNEAEIRDKAAGDFREYGVLPSVSKAKPE